MFTRRKGSLPCLTTSRERARDGEREEEKERERDKETATRERKLCITCLRVLGSLRGSPGPDVLQLKFGIREIIESKPGVNKQVQVGKHCTHVACCSEVIKNEGECTSRLVSDSKSETTVSHGKTRIISNIVCGAALVCVSLSLSVVAFVF